MPIWRMYSLEIFRPTPQCLSALMPTVPAVAMAIRFRHRSAPTVTRSRFAVRPRTCTWKTAGGSFGDVYLRDLLKNTTRLLSLDTRGTANGNSNSTAAVISSDGRSVAFSSNASNLVAGDFNLTADVFAATIVKTMPGDLDGDGKIAAGDVSSMIVLLSDLQAYKNNHGLSNSGLAALADINGDGAVDNLDIQALLTLLAHIAAGGGAVDNSEIASTPLRAEPVGPTVLIKSDAESAVPTSLASNRLASSMEPHQEVIRHSPIELNLTTRMDFMQKKSTQASSQAYVPFQACRMLPVQTSSDVVDRFYEHKKQLIGREQIREDRVTIDDSVEWLDDLQLSTVHW